jgi:hypothetical protein
VIALKSLEPFTVAKRSQEFVKFSVIYFSLSFATTLVTTLLIALKIVLIRRAIRDGRSQFKSHSLIELPVESAALYSTTLLIFLVLDVRKNKNVYYAQNIHAQMTVSASSAAA